MTPEQRRAIAAKIRLQLTVRKPGGVRLDRFTAAAVADELDPQ